MLLAAVMLGACTMRETFREAGSVVQIGDSLSEGRRQLNAQSLFREGRSLVESGKAEEGLEKVEQAVKLDPRAHEYRAYWARQRDLALQNDLGLAEGARARSDWPNAELAYKRMLAIDPGNARARTGLDALPFEKRLRAELTEAEALLNSGDNFAAQQKVLRTLAEDPGNRDAQRLARRIEEKMNRDATAMPKLKRALQNPVTLEFRDASLRTVFELLSRQTGLNFIFDKDVRADLKTTIFVRDTSIDDAIRFILVTNQLERKVLNHSTVLIYPNTVPKLREYQDLVFKSFYLRNAEVKQTAAMVKALVKTKDMYVDEKLNLLMLRDTPDAVRMAEKLIANQDLAEPEVMLELEVMEVATSLLTELGIRYPSQVSYSVVGAAGTAGTLTQPEFQNRNSGLVRMSITDPALIGKLKSQESRTNTLANPRIRVRNREKAKVHIGDKVPVITTTTTATGFAAESVAYLDVGLKLEVAPNVYLQDEVGIKVALEVSTIAREVRSAAGTLTYQIGTRNASTALRLHDGETQVLAGLISDEDRKNIDKVPGLGGIPVLGRLFSSHNDTDGKTEIVLLVTPHIVRNITRPGFRLEEFPSGTEAVMGAAPLVLRAAETDAAAAVAMQGAKLAAAAPVVIQRGGSARISLQAPPSVQAGREVQLVVNLQAEGELR
ncbi:MAG: secretin N-terminal domain-containing protein, partial [Actinomycetota bacterium]